MAEDFLHILSMMQHEQEKKFKEVCSRNNDVTFSYRIILVGGHFMSGDIS